jgi:hypothetical protein
VRKLRVEVQVGAVIELLQAEQARRWPHLLHQPGLAPAVMADHQVRHEAGGVELRHLARAGLGADRLGLEIDRPRVDAARAVTRRHVPVDRDALDLLAGGDGERPHLVPRLAERAGQVGELPREVLVQEQDAHHRLAPRVSGSRATARAWLVSRMR